MVPVPAHNRLDVSSNLTPATTRGRGALARASGVGKLHARVCMGKAAHAPHCSSLEGDTLGGTQCIIPLNTTGGGQNDLLTVISPEGGGGR